MDITFIITFGVLFLISFFFGFHNQKAPLIVVAAILAFLIGIAMFSTGVSLKTGTNSTLSEDNRTVEHIPTYTDLPQSWINALSMIFVIIALWLAAEVAISRQD